MTYECGRKRQEIKLLKEGGANEDDLIAARSRYRGTSAEYTRFSKAMDLPQQRERVTVDGLGTIGQGKYKMPVDKSAENDIIEIDKGIFPDTLAGVKRGELMTFEEADTGRVNPNYGDTGYDSNCQTCVVAFEARQRGYDVEALPNTHGSMLEVLEKKTNLAWIDPKTGKNPSYIMDKTKTTPKEYLGFIKDTIHPGERYTIEFDWKGRRPFGHIVNIDRDELGQLRIKDNQRPINARSEWVGDKAVLGYLSKRKYVQTVYGYKMPCVPKLLRIDNMRFDSMVVDRILKGV